MTTITFTPNFVNMFNQFLRDAVGHANHTLNYSKRHAPEELSRARNFIVSLNIAAQAMITDEQILCLRKELNKLSTAFAVADDAAKGY